VLRAGVAIEPGEQRRLHLAREVGELPLPRRREDAARHREARHLDDVERPDGDGDQVARQRRRLREAHRLPAGLGDGGRSGRRVGGGGEAGGHRELERPWDLELRLVPAREAVPRVGGLELREDVVLAVGLDVVDAHRVGVELLVEVEREHVLARGERARRLQLDDAVGERPGLEVDRLAARERPH
jgi:hypothetical protein